MTRNLMLHYMALLFVFQSINFPTMNLKIYRLKIFKLRIQLFKYHPRRDKSPRKKISVWNDLTEPFCRVLLSRFFAQPRADIRSIRDGIKSDQPARIRGWLYRNWEREEKRKIRCFAENFYVIRRFLWTVSFALIQLFSFCFMLIGGFSTILLANFAASSFLSKPKIQIPRTREILTSWRSSRNFSKILNIKSMLSNICWDLKNEWIIIERRKKLEEN